MKRTLLLCSGLACLLLTTTAFGLKSGDTIYVRARGTDLYRDTNRTKMGVTHQPGDRLIWLRQDPANPRYHEVKNEKGQKGYVWFQAVSITPPRGEVVIKMDKAAKIDAQAFASHGAAARGLTAEAKAAAEKKKTKGTAEQLELAESIAKNQRRSPK